MSGSVNKVILIGHLGRDPEIRATQAGQKIATLSIATSERWTDKATGEKRERTEWHRVVIFNEGLAGVAERFLKKGSSVYLEGQLATRKYTDQAGIERATTEVVLKAYRGEFALLDSAGRPAPNESDYGTERARTPAAAPAGGADLDDDIPF